MESSPNKITDTMGIVADVNLRYEGKLQYIEIIVDKYPSLISYHGKYFYRSGSTMRTIAGKELDRTRNGMPISKLKVADLRRGRLTEEETKVDDTILMENFHLIDEDDSLIEQFMFPQEAFREILLNAVVHKADQRIRG